MKGAQAGVLALLVVGCGFDTSGADGAGGDRPGGDGSDPGGVEPDATVQVSGDVIDFVTGAPVAGEIELTALGFAPGLAFDVSVTGSTFAIGGVPRQSVLFLVVSAPGHRATVNEPVVVGDDDVDDVALLLVSTAYAGSLAEEFAMVGITLVLAQAQDADAQPMIGIDRGVFETVPATGAGPYLLMADLAPERDLTVTSESGYVVFGDVAPGEVRVQARPGSGYQVDAGAAMIETGQAALFRARASPGELELPQDIDLGRDILPMFARRGCTQCHTRSGPGKQLGGLSLDGGTHNIWVELTQEVSPRSGIRRVDVTDPSRSLVLTRPSAEFPPDVHPYTTFNGVLDDDYLTLLSWIVDGAAN